MSYARSRLVWSNEYITYDSLSSITLGLFRNPDRSFYEARYKNFLVSYLNSGIFNFSVEDTKREAFLCLHTTRISASASRYTRRGANSPTNPPCKIWIQNTLLHTWPYRRSGWLIFSLDQNMHAVLTQQYWTYATFVVCVCYRKTKSCKHNDNNGALL